MKIPLQILDNGMAAVEATVSAPQYRLSLFRVTFIIDTGSGETIINEGDTIKRFSFSVSSLPFHRSTSIANVNFELRKMENVTISFLTDEPAKIEKINLPFILVSRATKRDPENLNKAYIVPSLLGIDFLLNAKFRLFLSSYEKKAYFEKIEDS